MKIRAAVLHEMGKERPYTTSKPLTIQELDLQAPQEGEVLVKIRAAGLCHSDLSVIDGNRPRQMPMALGHEAAGEVVELGPGVHDLAVGDHIVFSFLPICGHCMPCMTGRPALCENGLAANNKGELMNGGMRLQDQQYHPVHHHMGVSGFAEYSVVSRKSIVRIDSTLPFDIAALFGCAIMTGVGAVINTAKLTLGQTVLITGMGGIGFAALLGALAGGASKIIVADVNKDKLAKALELGAHHVVDSSEANAVEQVRDLTRGGVDIGFEFAGVVPALEFTYNATGRGGKTVTAGLPHPSKMLQLSPTKLVADERTLQGSYIGSCVPARDIPAYISLYQAGRLPVDKLMTHKIRLDDINEGFERLAKGEAIRQVITF
ncbi:MULTISPECIES: zinc-dependent alcohol dehydrogenase family protein [unclassified Spirosoma]|uniref:zinc-dependent alcohol dehydrogenase family protein n=1 Tax=unclassified Spirosoma TaxID=2621999 RepID=UPI00095AAAEA|nr:MULTISPECIES: zinc-dependent alcohol dehydrogenase family protein [unclassified Spirosoma]MBN8824488.1 zinc-dependent alcohol dehydrogenase family protein [Spirosoma sp.]OJW70861.1 MAG: alcohol dehydrogenase [Spirosoma sp. 48-14]